MRDFAIHTLAMVAGTAFILYVFAGFASAGWNVLRRMAGLNRGGGRGRVSRPGPYRGDRSASELYERRLRGAHRH